jgi:hypothetical protein
MDKDKAIGFVDPRGHSFMGLRGEGNLLVFDNGGWAGYGAPHPSAPDGLKTALRDHSRVLEIDPGVSSLPRAVRMGSAAAPAS